MNDRAVAHQMAIVPTILTSYNGTAVRKTFIAMSFGFAMNYGRPSRDRGRFPPLSNDCDDFQSLSENP